MESEKILQNEVMVIDDVSFTVPVITFTSFEDLKKRAEEVSEFISSVTLTEENEQEVKKILANARKLTAALDDKRKEIKKEITAPVKVFEAQVKEVTSIIEAAENELRAEIRVLEERARDEKENKLLEIWNKRCGQYTFTKYISDGFSLWLKPKHLNKSTSIKQSEDDMVDFMERVEKDVSAILSMPDAVDVMTEYSCTLDLAYSIEKAKEKEAYRGAAFDEKDPETERAVFVIEGKVEITLTEKLLSENGIKFVRK